MKNRSFALSLTVGGCVLAILWRLGIPLRFGMCLLGLAALMV